jgi:hypothetical protein
LVIVKQNYIVAAAVAKRNVAQVFESSSVLTVGVQLDESFFGGGIPEPVAHYFDGFFEPFFPDLIPRT